jgi:hypothetical protein
MADDKGIIPKNHGFFEGLGDMISDKCKERGLSPSKLTLSFINNSVQYRFTVKSIMKSIFPVVITIQETESRLLVVKTSIDYHPDTRGGKSKAPLSKWDRFWKIGDEYSDSVDFPVDGRGIKDDKDVLHQIEATVIVCTDSILKTTTSRLAA